jgi:hypothetical protein
MRLLLGDLALCILLIILTTGCSKNEQVSSSYVQDVVPEQQNPALWFLSPSGDKLFYNTESGRNQATVRFLATSQEFTIADCPRFSWLDNESVYCYDFHNHHYVPSQIIDNISSNTDAFQKTSIKAITAEQIELDMMLKQAKSLYRLQTSLTQPDSLLVLDKEPQENAKQYYHITGIENLDKVLKNYTYTPIPLDGSFAESSKKIYSPNGEYYYLLQDSLGIYDAASDRLLAEFKQPSDYESFFEIGGFFPNKSEGWAADSSGIYFQIFHTIGLGPRPPIQPIQKLCVPGVSGCPPAN